MVFMTFHSVGNGKIIPTDFHSIIFQMGRSTTNQLLSLLSFAMFDRRLCLLATPRDPEMLRFLPNDWMVAISWVDRWYTSHDLLRVSAMESGAGFRRKPQNSWVNNTS